MKNYVRSTQVTGALTLIAIALTIIFHIILGGEEMEFWRNVCLAVFGSGLLTFITSIIGYFSEKRKTLEGFAYSTRILLRKIDKYDADWELDKKIDFFLEYMEFDKYIWDAQFGSICFLCDTHRKKYNYIYDCIYMPISNFNKMVSEKTLNFRWHKDGTGKNDEVIEGFIKEIESLFWDIGIQDEDIENGASIKRAWSQNILLYNIKTELNGRYYELMYGNKTKKRNDYGKDENGIN